MYKPELKLAFNIFKMLDNPDKHKFIERVLDEMIIIESSRQDTYILMRCLLFDNDEGGITNYNINLPRATATARIYN
jgi:hypothetical protein